MRYDVKTSLKTYIIKIFFSDINQWRYFSDFTSSEDDMKMLLTNFLHSFSSGAFDKIEVISKVFGLQENTFKVLFDDSTEMLYSITLKN